MEITREDLEKLQDWIAECEENEANKEDEIKVLVYKVGEPPEVRTIKNELEDLQAIVGGYIECVALGNNIIAVVNEEGILLELKRNRMFVGDFFICKSVTPEFGSLSDEEIKMITRRIP